MATNSKAVWKANTHKIWVELYVEHMKKYGRCGGGITKDGHTQFAKAFKEKTKLDYTSIQLKHRWDYVKESWKAWKVLTNKSGLGWDPELRTFEATNDQWKAYSKANKYAGQFKTKNLEYETKLDMIFRGTVATSEGMMSPNADPTLFDSVIKDMTYDDVAEDVRQTSEISISSFESPTIEVNDDNANIQGLQRRRPKECEATVNTSKKMKKERSASARMTTCIEALGNSISESDKKKGIENMPPMDLIIACIEKLDALPEVKLAGKIYLFAIDTLFLKAEYRSTFLGIKKPKVCLTWLKMKYKQVHGEENLSDEDDIISLS